MPLIIPPGFGQAVYEFSITGDSETMVCTMGHDLSFWDGDFQDAVNRLHTDFGASWVQAWVTTTTFTGVTLYVGQDGGPPAVYVSTNANVVGTSTGGGIAPNCALLVRKRTDLAGKRGRGRIYMPGITELAVDQAGNVLSANQTAYQGYANDWYADLTTATPGAEPNPPVVLHRSEGAGAEPAPTPITQFVVDGKIATQRQRLRR